MRVGILRRVGWHPWRGDRLPGAGTGGSSMVNEKDIQTVQAKVARFVQRGKPVPPETRGCASWLSGASAASISARAQKSAQTRGAVMTKESRAADIPRSSSKPCEAGVPRSKRFVLFDMGGLAELPTHAKVASYLLARDRLTPLLSETERVLLISIGTRARPSKRHQWALRELSQRVALLDLAAGVELELVSEQPQETKRWRVELGPTRHPRDRGSRLSRRAWRLDPAAAVGLRGGLCRLDLAHDRGGRMKPPRPMHGFIPYAKFLAITSKWKERALRAEDELRRRDAADKAARRPLMYGGIAQRVVAVELPKRDAETER